MSLLNIKDMRVEFPSRRGSVTAVRDVDFELASGEILGIVGESGAGKSTIANAILGLLEPPGIMPKGEVSLDGERIDGLPIELMRKIRGKRIGMIFQDPLTSLNPLQTIEEQLVETIRVHLQLNENEAKKHAISMLDQVGIPEPDIRIKHYPHQFSGGMRQRVVIALSLCAKPEVILADEPTTALDVSIQAQILDLMRKLVRDTGVGMIIITHDMGVISEICDRVMVMYRGDVVETGPTKKILGNPDHPYTQSLISAVPRADKRMDRFPLVEYIEAAGTPHKPIDVQNHWLGEARNFDASENDFLVSVKDLEMRFTTVRSMFKSRRRYLKAVDKVSFDIRPGEVLGLVGESGSGKSTVARLICGIYKPYAGQVIFDGTDLTSLGSRREVNIHRRQMQMIFQDPFSSLNGRMRVFDIVAEPIKFHRLASSNSEVSSIVDDLLDHVGLGAAAGKKFPHEFSGGQRQR
ncbi:ABC transporter, ATP-binding protein (cluster 5, nickel/peptides/opines) / ABC transporter, ATP-binding protein (cluster 5, nickel/peptides/opines), partial [hydrothermal vent metagenome]